MNNVESAEAVGDKYPVSAAMTSLGIIYSPSLHWPAFNGIVGGYLFVGLGILAYSLTTEVTKLSTIDDASEKRAVEVIE